MATVITTVFKGAPFCEACLDQQPVHHSAGDSTATRSRSIQVEQLLA